MTFPSFSFLFINNQGLFTRSKTVPFDRNVCFFCDGQAKYQQPLHLVSTTSAGNSLAAAVKRSSDPRLLVKLSTAADNQDAHAIDIKYHRNCWAKHVTGVLRNESIAEKNSEIAAKIEFLTLVEIVLNDGQIVNMAQLEEAYECIRRENNVQLGSVSRKSIKELIQREIESVEFHKQRKFNKPEVVSVKQSRDGAIQLSTESMNENASSKMKSLYNAALILRNAINKSDPWSFSGSLETPSEDHCPVELSSFFRWIIQKYLMKTNALRYSKGPCIWRRVR